MIDIIIPAYNCSKTLYKTLSSLETQTDDNFKVIVVDDCSTEDIASIIKEKQSHLNITYIRKEKNEGCGMARQTGIDNSISEYFTFLDSDDILMPYAVEIFNSMIRDNDYDVYHSYFYQQIKINGKSALKTHKDGYIWCHGKLYKRSFIEKYNIKNSPLVKYADDSYFNSICMELGTVGIIPMEVYLWMDNESSITRDKSGEYKKDSLSDFINAMRLSTEFLLKYKDLSEIRHLKSTIQHVKEDYARDYDILSNEEKDKINNLFKKTKNIFNL